MTIVRVGSNQKYSEGWEAAFSKGKKSAAQAVGGAKSGTAKKAAGKKASAKKKAGKKARR